MIEDGIDRDLNALEENYQMHFVEEINKFFNRTPTEDEHMNHSFAAHLKENPENMMCCRVSFA